MKALLQIMLIVFALMLCLMMAISLISTLLPWYLSLPAASITMWFVLNKLKFELRERIIYLSSGLSFLVVLLISQPLLGNAQAATLALLALAAAVAISYKATKKLKI